MNKWFLVNVTIEREYLVEIEPHDIDDWQEAEHVVQNELCGEGSKFLTEEIEEEYLENLKSHVHPDYLIDIDQQ